MILLRRLVISIRRGLILFKKKGQSAVMDSIVFIIVIIVFGMTSMFGYQIFTDMSSDVSSDLQMNESKAIVTEVETRYPFVFDGLILLIFAGIWIAGLAAAYYSDTHPMIFGFMMIAIVFVIIAGAMLGNFYEELFDDSSLISMKTSMPVTNWILSHMLPIGIVVALSIVLVLIGKNKL